MMSTSGTAPSTSSKKQLPDIWLKAAMLGSLWASVEIILGSFLHNLHIPFSGTFLAALGLTLMINGYKLWPEKGLFWRTALITAIMKSMSPSAIIFGPMVGIFMEGVILEISTRLFRNRWPGFIIGGALAVSWSLFQKIFVMLMTYGPDFVKLYEQLYLMAAKSLQISGSVPIDLVKLIFVIDLIFGATVAAFAIRTSGHQKKVLHDSIEEQTHSKPEDILAVSGSQTYSVMLFFLNLIILIGGLSILRDLSLSMGFVLVILYISFNIVRYSRSLNRLKRPQLWIQLIALMGLSGLLLGGWESQEAIMNGLEIGLGMAMRALLVIFGFSALSIEVRNPLILNWFSRKGMRIAFESISVAFEVLPRLIQVVSKRKRQWKHPFRTLNQLLGVLEQLRREHANEPATVILIIGDQGEGKTELIKALLQSKKMQDLTFSGFYTEGNWLDGERDHYHIVDVNSHESALLCERKDPKSEITSGPFNFRQSGIDFGCSILQNPHAEHTSIVIIDEIGHLELRNEGWSQCMQSLINQRQPMIWTVRRSLVEKITAKWDLDFVHFNLSENQIDDLTHQVQLSLS